VAVQSSVLSASKWTLIVTPPELTESSPVPELPGTKIVTYPALHSVMLPS
jgi:hypothetical protein